MSLTAYRIYRRCPVLLTCLFIYAIFLLIAVMPAAAPALYAEEEREGSELVSPSPDAEATTRSVPVENTKKETGEKESANIDAQLLYGQYNNIFSSISLIQNNKKFAYQLNSELRRSNDFGYKNSSFFNNQIGFSGKADFNRTWTLIPEIAVNNESHGMFDNTTFSREEKDKIVIFLENEYKPTPARWYFNVGGAQYVHRLTGSDPVSFSFYKFSEEIQWEYVWSASNSLAIRHYYWQYFYNDGNAKNDAHIANELLINFKLTEYVKFSCGAIADWNRDAGWFPSGRVSLSSSNLKYFSFEGTYSYVLDPFQPEDIFFNQKYVAPGGELPPSRTHEGAVDATFDISFKKKSTFHVKKIKLKAKGVWEKQNNFYNFTTSETYSGGGVLELTSGKVTTLYSVVSLLLDFSIFSHRLRLNAAYRFQYFDAPVSITYHPVHCVTGKIAYRASRWELSWENSYRGSVFTDAESDVKLSDAITGDLQIQYRMISTLYFNIRLQNLYNNSYSLISGYPEPGFTALVGLRIVI